VSILDVDLDNLSIMEQIALLDEIERESIIGDWSPDDLADAELWLRPDQLDAYHDEASIVGIMAGRGGGKTLTGSEWSKKKAQGEPTIGHLVGRTVSDVRDVMIQGESGILAVSAPSFMPVYTPSLRKLVMPRSSRTSSSPTGSSPTKVSLTASGT